MIVILFTTHAPDTLLDGLVRQGHEVYEALAISEVMALAEQQPTASIIITPEWIRHALEQSNSIGRQFSCTESSLQ